MALVLENLTKRFGSVVALDGISFSVEPGEVFGFLGANGAGKTTAMRIILDILRADSGTATWNGQPTADAPRATWGYLPEDRGLYPRMEILEQLVFFGDLFKVPRRVAARARAGVAEPVPDPGIREAPRRGALEGQPAEDPVHRRRAPRAARAPDGRAVQRPGPGERRTPQGSLHRDALARDDDRLLDPSDGPGRGAVRIRDPDRPRQGHPGWAGARRSTLDRAAGRPARRRRRHRAGLAVRSARRARDPARPRLHRVRRRSGGRP